ncbi:monocarboxylate transporter 13-like [Ptychodera flava]|uniref:monocarboxylate transporter 13-like n=1 Tax=Ptychodera flava TaxID=63121 RepID=UPI00396A73D3
MSDVTGQTVHPPDGGWGWFVVIAMFISCFLCSGSYYAFSILYVAFLEKYQESKAATAFVGAMSGLGFVLMTSYGLALARKIGHRRTVMLGGVISFIGVAATAFATQLWQTYITFGLFVGTGLGFTFVVCIEMVGKYFKRKFSIAMGIAFAGTGVGQFALAIISQFLLEKYGLWGTLLISAAIFSNLCVAGALLKPLEVRKTSRRLENTAREQTEKQNTEFLEDNIIENGSNGLDNNDQVSAETDKKKTRSFLMILLTALYDFSLCKEPIYLVILVIAACQMCGQASVGIHLVRRTRDLGIGPSQSAYLTAIMGLAQMIGRPAFGAIGNIHRLNPCIPFGISLIACGVSLSISSYSASFTAQLVFVIVFGICLGGYTVLNNVIVAYFMGKERLGYGVSFLLHVHGFVGLLVGPLIGWMRDSTDSYQGAFWLAGSAMALGGFLAFLLPMIDRLVKRNRGKREDNKC